MGYLAVLFHNNQTVSSGSTAAHLEYLGFRYLSLLSCAEEDAGEGGGGELFTIYKKFRSCLHVPLHVPRFSHQLTF